MKSKKYIVRIVKSSSKPYLPSAPSCARSKKRSELFLSKTLNIMAGSAIGFFAGISTCLMLKLIGAELGGAESSLIIGFPSVLGTLTSLAIF